MDACAWLCPLGLTVAGLIALSFLARPRRCPSCGLRGITSAGRELGISHWFCPNCQELFDADFKRLS